MIKTSTSPFFIQAYQTLPRRQQLQSIAISSLVVVFICLVAAVYLNITSQATNIGRDIQKIQYDIQEVSKNNQMLKVNIGQLSSSKILHHRSEKLGFSPIFTQQITFITADGYEALQEASIAPPHTINPIVYEILPAEYTYSISDWVANIVNRVDARLGAKP
jgi:cell division protein FtsL